MPLVGPARNQVPLSRPPRSGTAFYRRMARLALVATGLVLFTPATSLSDVMVTRTTFAGPYVPISVDSGASVANFTNLDDGSMTFSLPFSFQVGTKTWTPNDNMVLTTNGYAYFSSLWVTSDSNPDNTKLFSGSPSILAPWWDDVTLEAVGSNPQGQVLAQVRGDPGSRNLVVQWTNVSSYYTATGGQPRQLNFQAIIYEGTNVIEFLYGPATGGPGNVSESASIGMSDPTGGARHYVDGITGSGVTSHGMINSSHWPTHHVRFSPGFPMTIPGGSYSVGSGGDYPSLSEAVADLNHRGVSGAVEMILTDTVYDSTTNSFPILLGPIRNSGSWPVTIRPSAERSALVSVGAQAGVCGNEAATNIITTTNEPVLGIVGASNVTIRALDLVTAGAGRVDRGLLVVNSSGIGGASNNTFEEIGVTLSRSNTSSLCVQQTVVTSPTNTNGSNSGNAYRRLTLASAVMGLHLNGNSAWPDRNCRVESGPGGATTIGGPGSAVIGGSSDSWGIRAGAQQGLIVSGCDVQYIQGTSTATVSGIWIDNSGTATTDIGVTQLSENRVHDLSSTGTGAVRGLRINLPASASSRCRAFNNLVYGLTSSASSSSTLVTGISLQEAGGGVGATAEIDFNSVRLAPTGLNCSNACLAAGTDTGPAIRVRNNVLANLTDGQTSTRKHYCWLTAGTTSIGPVGSVSDHNVLYISQPTGGYIGYSGAGDLATLADWRSMATGIDENSFNRDPGFVGAGDLHIDTAPSPTEATASWFDGAISWAPEDQDGDLRDLLAPDIGADEGAHVPLPNPNLRAESIVVPAAGTDYSTSETIQPLAAFGNQGTAPLDSATVRFEIRGPTPLQGLVYDGVQILPPLKIQESVAVAFPEVILTSPGSYVARAIAGLAGDGLISDDTVQVNLNVRPPLNGIYRVQSGQPSPFNSLGTALAHLVRFGADGPVILELGDALYWGPIDINPFPGASEDNRLTIRPAPGVNPVIWGQEFSTVLLTGVSHVTIDGEDHGDGGRHLTIRTDNYYEFPRGAAVHLSSLGPGQGCTDVIVRNCRISSYLEQTAPGSSTVAILVGGATTSVEDGGEDNDDNQFCENEITEHAWGIVMNGVPGNPNERNVIRGNIVGPPMDNSSRIGKAGIVLMHQSEARVLTNEVRNVGLTSWNGVPGVDHLGIAIGARSWPPDSLTTCAGIMVAGNRIHNVVEQGTRSAIGILLAGRVGSSGNVIANNMIDGVRANAGEADQTAGLALTGASTGDLVAFNTIRLTGDLDPGASPPAATGAIGLHLAMPAPADLKVVNNIVSVDLTGNDSGLVHYGVVVSSGNLDFTTGGLDHNDYDVSSVNPQMVMGGVGTAVPYVPVTGLVPWRALFSPPQDFHSLDVSPPFLSVEDLHLLPAAVTPLRSGAEPLVLVTDDIDGDPRDPLAPDIGADEVLPPPPGLTIHDVSGPEGNAGLTPFAFGLSLSAASADTVTVVWSTRPASAGADTDYVSVAIGPVVTFLPGDTTSSIAVNVIGDQVVEGDETFEVVLTGATSAVLVDSVGVGQIVNDDTISGVEERGLPATSFLAAPHPNPASGQAVIEFGLHRPESVTLQIFDIRGRLIRTLQSGPKPAGYAQERWDGLDDGGRPVASGIYLVRLVAGDRAFRQILHLVK